MTKFEIFLYNNVANISTQVSHDRVVLVGSNNKTDWTSVYDSYAVLNKNINYITVGDKTYNSDALNITVYNQYKYYRYIIRKISSNLPPTLSEIKFYFIETIGSITKTITNPLKSNYSTPTSATQTSFLTYNDVELNAMKATNFLNNNTDVTTGWHGLNDSYYNDEGYAISDGESLTFDFENNSQYLSYFKTFLYNDNTKIHQRIKLFGSNYDFEGSYRELFDSYDVLNRNVEYTTVGNETYSEIFFVNSKNTYRYYKYTIKKLAIKGTPVLNGIKFYFNNNCDNIYANIDKLNNSVNSNTSSINYLNSSVNSHVEGLNTSISTLNTNVDTNTASISTLNTNVDTNTASISTLNTKVDTNTASISTLNTKVATNTSSISTLNTKVDTNTASISTLTESINSTVNFDSDIVEITPVSATASSTLTGSYSALNAINNIINNTDYATGWHGSTDTGYDTNGYGGEYLTFDFGTTFSKILTSFKIFLYSGTQLATDRLHERIILSGSNDMSNWVSVYNSYNVLGRSIQYITVGSQTYNLDILNESSRTVYYRYYRYTISKISKKQYPVLNEIKFYFTENTFSLIDDNNIVRSSIGANIGANIGLLNIFVDSLTNYVTTNKIVNIYSSDTTFTILPNYRNVTIEMIGGGGSGAVTDYPAGGGGGGAGAYAKLYFTKQSLDLVLYIKIGGGGDRVVTNNTSGNTGGSTILYTIIPYGKNSIQTIMTGLTTGNYTVRSSTNSFVHYAFNRDINSFWVSNPSYSGTVSSVNTIISLNVTVSGEWIDIFDSSGGQIESNQVKLKSTVGNMYKPARISVYGSQSGTDGTWNKVCESEVIYSNENNVFIYTISYPVVSFKYMRLIVNNSQPNANKVQISEIEYMNDLETFNITCYGGQGGVATTAATGSYHGQGGLGGDVIVSGTLTVLPQYITFPGGDGGTANPGLPGSIQSSSGQGSSSFFGGGGRGSVAIGVQVGAVGGASDGRAYGSGGGGSRVIPGSKGGNGIMIVSYNIL